MCVAAPESHRIVRMLHGLAARGCFFLGLTIGAFLGDAMTGSCGPRFCIEFVGRESLSPLSRLRDALIVTHGRRSPTRSTCGNTILSTVPVFRWPGKATFPQQLPQGF